MIRKDKNEYLIQSVSLACTLMEQFRSVERQLSIADLSRMLRVNKNYVFRLLATLERRNFVERDPQTGSYRLGITTLQMGESCYRSKRLIREAHAALDQMAKLSRETSMLHVLSDGDLVCVDSVESQLPVRVRVNTGSSLTLQTTAAGRTMLAFGNDSDLLSCQGPGSLAEPCHQSAPHALQFLKKLQRIREQGYAISYGEFKPDVCAVAAPVRDQRSRLLGVIGVAAPCCRISFELLDCEIAPLVVKGARDLSATMGFWEDKDAAVEQSEAFLQRPVILFPPEAHGGHDSGGIRRNFAFGNCRLGHQSPEAVTAAA